MKSLRVPDSLKRLWDVWDLRIAVLVSLYFQILLIVIASLRKRTGNIYLTIFVWSAYLLADWIATFAVGLIASGMSDCGLPALNEDLITFWAPFLLVHLGGPHNITAFSLEDNELWIRHMFQLVIHLVSIAYVFTQSLPNNLWIPTALVYFAGLNKYVERTRALYLASLGTFKNTMLPPPSAGSNYARLMQAYKSKFDASIPVEIFPAETPQEKPPAYSVDQNEDQLTKIEVVQNGYRFFNDFKGLIVDLTYGKRDWEKTREFFFRRTAKEVFSIMEVELNFLYDLLYTKMGVVHSKLGFFFRFVCLGFMVLALERFVSHHKHHNEIRKVDIYITYALLIGGIGLDVLGIIKLIFSDWTIAVLKNYKFLAKFPKLGTALFNIRINSSFDKNYRWSKSLSQHSLIAYCLKERLKWINKLVDTFGAKDFLDELQYKGTEHVNKDPNKFEDLNKLIFNELSEKARTAENAKDAKEICSWRGKRVLLQAPRFYSSLAESVEVEYDESVLRWHVATELCYYETKDSNNDNRKFCKIMSQYMLYLLVMRPTMMSAVAGIVQIRFQDTCAEAKKFFRSLSGKEQPRNFFGCRTALPRKPKDACEELLQVDTVVAADKVKAGTSKSVLFDACIMAKDLQKFNEKERWEIMSKVWVELLCYAASHCRAHAHAQQLSKGGEFITFVWLLMIHFGVGEQFRIDPESRYKLIVSK